MNYVTVFECMEVDISYSILIYVIAIVLGSLMTLWAIWLLEREKRRGNSRVRKYFLTTGIITCLFGIVTFLSNIIATPIYKEFIYDKYLEGNTYVVEGYADTETFMDDDYVERIDSMTVNNISFFTDSKYNYNYSEEHDLCVSDGDYVRITYVTYRNHNLIMKIEKSNDSTEMQ